MINLTIQVDYTTMFGKPLTDVELLGHSPTNPKKIENLV